MKNFPIAKSLWESEISLPVYVNLTLSQVKEVVNAVVKAVQKIKK